MSLYVNHKGICFADSYPPEHDLMGLIIPTNYLPTDCNHCRIIGFCIFARGLFGVFIHVLTCKVMIINAIIQLILIFSILSRKSDATHYKLTKKMNVYKCPYIS